MRNHHNSHERAGTSNTRREAAISGNNENLNCPKPRATRKSKSCTPKNASDNNQPNSSANQNLVQNKSKKRRKTSTRSQIVNNSIDTNLQQTESVFEHLCIEVGAAELPDRARSSRLEESMSSNSSSDDSVAPNLTPICTFINLDVYHSTPQTNRRLEGVASDSEVTAAIENPPINEQLAHTRSEIIIEDEVNAELLRIREEYLRTQEPIIVTRLPIESNHRALDSIPETAHDTSRHIRRGNRILRYYRSLRSSVDENSTIAQHRYTTPPLAEAPPTYSAVIRNDDIDALIFSNRNEVEVQQSAPFIAPRPPPTYAEAEGLNIDRPTYLTSIEQLVWGPEPTYIVCPRCAHLILTSTHTRISSVNHISAIILCLCGCWPCCFIPYCIDSCKNTYHYCPNCSLFLGVYHPW